MIPGKSLAALADKLVVQALVETEEAVVAVALAAEAVALASVVVVQVAEAVELAVAVVRGTVPAEEVVVAEELWSVEHKGSEEKMAVSVETMGLGHSK